MKKTIVGLTTFALAVSACFTGAVIADNETKDAITIVMEVGNPIMTVNGSSEEIDPGCGTAPIIRDERTLVPVRAIIEAMDGTVEWDEGTQTASLSYHDDVIRLTIGSETAYLNENAHRLDVTPVIVNGRTMLPIRFIAESFDFAVEWDGEDSRITITKNENAAEPDPSEKPQDTAEPDSSEKPQDTAEPNPTDQKKILVAYFSQERAVTEDMDARSAATPPIGNTATAARLIGQRVDGNLFEIVTVTDYPTDDNSSSGIAQRELSEDARPELLTHVEDMDSYDTVFLGFPIWWGYEPMAVRTFLEEYDFSGKTIIPFCMSGENSVTASEKDIQKLCPDASVLEGLTLTELKDNYEELITEWLDKLGLTE